MAAAIREPTPRVEWTLAPESCAPSPSQGPSSPWRPTRRSAQCSVSGSPHPPASPSPNRHDAGVGEKLPLPEVQLGRAGKGLVPGAIPSTNSSQTGYAHDDAASPAAGTRQRDPPPQPQRLHADAEGDREKRAQVRNPPPPRRPWAWARVELTATLNSGTRMQFTQQRRGRGPVNESGEIPPSQGQRHHHRLHLQQRTAAAPSTC